MNDLRFACRQLLRNPGVTAVAVVSLALGIGLNSAVFSIINAVFFGSIHGVAQPRRVLFASERVSYPAFQHLRTESRTVSALAATTGANVTVQLEGQSLHKGVPVVSDNFFATMGIRPMLGRFFDSQPTGLPSAVPEVVLDHQFWQRNWNSDPAAIGQRLVLNNVSFTIVGVGPEHFYGPGPERPLGWVPLGALPLLEGHPIRWEDTGDRRFGLCGRLRPEASLAQAQAEFAGLLALQPELAPPKPILLGGGRQIWTGGTSVEKQAEFLLVTVVPLVAVGTILWIACSNVANLLLARAVARRREIAIRLATGASRGRVVRLLMLESLCLAVLGGGLGLLVSAWTVDFVFATFTNFTFLTAPVDGHVLAYTAGISLLSTLLFGLVPALQATRTDVASALKSEGAGSVSGWRSSRLRTFFLITQIAGSMALLVVTATFVRSVTANRFGETARLIDHLLVAQFPEAWPASAPAGLQRQLREQIGALPGVRTVTLGTAGQGETARLFVAGSEGQTNAPSVTVQKVDAAFFQATGRTLLRGHNVDPSAAVASGEAVVINEAAARLFWPGLDALGQRFQLDAITGLEVAGVIRDQDSSAQVYRPFPASAVPTQALVQTEVPSGQLVVPLRQLLQRLAPQPSFPQVAPLREAQSRGLVEITQVTVLVGGLALLLAATGIFGSMAFSSSQRTREMGIRLALGASRIQVVRLLLGQGFKIASLGCVIGLVLVAVAFQFMNGLIFGKWTLELSVLAAVATVFTLVTLLACWLPARRASRVDPMVTLRSE
jgi:putative ABC transport system permease protein